MPLINLDQSPVSNSLPTPPPPAAVPTTPPSSPSKRGKRPPLGAREAQGDAVDGPTSHSRHAYSTPDLGVHGALNAPAPVARASSAGQIAKVVSRSPAATFHDLVRATLNSSNPSAHKAVAEGLALVIKTGPEGLKTVFGYDGQGRHVAFGSHDQLEASKTSKTSDGSRPKSTQHADLLRVMGLAIIKDPTGEDARLAIAAASEEAAVVQGVAMTQEEAGLMKKFGRALMLRTVNKNARVDVEVGGTRLEQIDNDCLRFDVSQGLGLDNKTPAGVLQAVAQFHANVLRLANMAHMSIKGLGDGGPTDDLAKRVQALLIEAPEKTAAVVSLLRHVQLDKVTGAKSP